MMVDQPHHNEPIPANNKLRKGGSTMKIKMTQTNLKDDHHDHYPKDGNLVGKAQILTESSNVYEAPTHINAPVPVPSIYKDNRGEIHNLYVGNKRLNLLYTKVGVMRSGDIHAHIQHDFIFQGKIQVWILTKDGTTQKHIYNKGQYITIPSFTPHIFEFLEDSIIAEWWDYPFKAWFYKPYRTIVQNSFSSSAGSTTKPGQFHHYIIEDKPKEEKKEVIDDEKKEKCQQQQAIIIKYTLPTWFSGLAVGLCLGYFIVGSRTKH